MKKGGISNLGGRGWRLGQILYFVTTLVSFSDKNNLMNEEIEKIPSKEASRGRSNSYSKIQHEDAQLGKRGTFQT